MHDTIGRGQCCKSPGWDMKGFKQQHKRLVLIKNIAAGVNIPATISLMSLPPGSACVSEKRSDQKEARDGNIPLKKYVFWRPTAPLWSSNDQFKPSTAWKTSILCNLCEQHSAFVQHVRLNCCYSLFKSNPQSA